MPGGSALHVRPVTPMDMRVSDSRFVQEPLAAAGVVSHTGVRASHRHGGGHGLSCRVRWRHIRCDGQRYGSPAPHANCPGEHTDRRGHRLACCHLDRNRGAGNCDGDARSTGYGYRDRHRAAAGDDHRAGYSDSAPDADPARNHDTPANRNAPANGNSSTHRNCTTHCHTPANRNAARSTNHDSRRRRV